MKHIKELVWNEQKRSILVFLILCIGSYFYKILTADQCQILPVYFICLHL